MNHTAIKEFQANHVAAWNERDRASRDALLNKIYADDVMMYDAHLAMTGIKAISDFIGNLLAKDPAFHFSAPQPMELIHDGARLFGEIKTGQGRLVSMDFFLFESGKVVRYYAFMAPAK